MVLVLCTSDHTAEDFHAAADAVQAELRALGITVEDFFALVSRDGQMQYPGWSQGLWLASAVVQSIAPPLVPLSGAPPPPKLPPDPPPPRGPLGNPLHPEPPQHPP